MRSRSSIGLVAALLFWAGCALPPAAHAQASVGDPVGEAQRLRDTGDFAGAARILQATLAAQPDAAAVAGLLAETLYWLRDVEGARAVYDAALVRHPRDPALLLPYARMLAETGDRPGARALLLPLPRQPPHADVDALLGTLAYWDGDFTTAERLFEAALRADPAHADARRQLQEIRSLTRSWVRVSSDLGHDDQPIDQVGLGVEAGWFATPLVPIIVRARPGRYRVDVDESRGWWEGEVEAAHFAPALRLDTKVAAGVTRHPSGAEALDWQGRAELGVRLPAHMSVGMRLERAPYLYTAASLDTPVTSRTATGLVRWQDPRGWVGEAAYGRQRFPDGNTIVSAYAWQLVPLVKKTTSELQAGYAFGREHAGESRFVLARTRQPFPPEDPRFSTAGRYDPYYTPSRLVSHSVIAAAMVRPSGSTTIRGGGSYALRATEEAPFLYVSAGQVLREMAPRTFSPWTARGSVEIALGDGVALAVQGELGSAAFYRWSTAGIHLTYRFASRAAIRTAVP